MSRRVEKSGFTLSTQLDSLPRADTPARAIEQLALLVLQAGFKLGREDVRHYVRQSVDVFVQLERRVGKRRVSQVMVAV